MGCRLQRSFLYRTNGALVPIFYFATVQYLPFRTQGVCLVPDPTLLGTPERGCAAFRRSVQLRSSPWQNIGDWARDLQYSNKVPSAFRYGDQRSSLGNFSLLVCQLIPSMARTEDDNHGNECMVRYNTTSLVTLHFASFNWSNNEHEEAITHRVLRSSVLCSPKSAETERVLRTDDDTWRLRQTVTNRRCLCDDGSIAVDCAAGVRRKVCLLCWRQNLTH
jgi:hypothetical protein